MRLGEQFRRFIFLAVGIPLVILMGASYLSFREQVSQNEENYLNLSMLYLDGILKCQMDKIQQLGEVYFQNETIANAIYHHDVAKIAINAKKFNKTIPNIDYIIVVDNQGNIVYKNMESVVYNHKSKIGAFVENSIKTDESLNAFEVLPLDNLFYPTSKAYERMMIPIKDDSSKKQQFLKNHLSGCIYILYMMKRHVLELLL